MKIEIESESNDIQYYACDSIQHDMNLWISLNWTN